MVRLVERGRGREREERTKRGPTKTAANAQQTVSRHATVVVTWLRVIFSAELSRSCREEPMASISSMKMMHGAVFFAAAKSSRTLFTVEAHVRVSKTNEVV